MNRISGIIAVIIASILWGTTGTAAAIAPELSPLVVGSVAMGLGGILQAVIAISSIIRDKSLLYINWHYLFGGALAVAIYPLAFYALMRFSGVTIGTVISIGSAPLLSAIIEYFFDKLQLNKQWLIGAIVGLIGMLLLCLAEHNQSTTSISNHYSMTGILLALVAGFTYALYSWSARRLMQKGISTKAAMGATFGIGGFLLMPILLITGAPLITSSINLTVGLYMAFFPMFLGYICYGFGLAQIHASMTTTITLLEPVVAAILAMVIIGERLPAIGWIGIVLIISCLILITVPLKVFAVNHI